MERVSALPLAIAPELLGTEGALRLAARFPIAPFEEMGEDPWLELTGEGLTLRAGENSLRGDFAHLLPRLKNGGLAREFLVRAAKIRGGEGPLRAVDATAGLGEDSFFLAAAGFEVTLFERNPAIFSLLEDAIRRAGEDPALAPIAGRMEARWADSLEGMAALSFCPDVVLLDPMFPQRQKSALVKKKLQFLQKLETPCQDEGALLLAAMETRPKKLLIKRPPKGPWLAGVKPDHALEGKAVRFDCIVSPYDRIGKFRSQLGF